MIPLFSQEIVIWNGAITTYGVIRDLVEDGEMVELANDEEKERYKKVSK